MGWTATDLSAGPGNVLGQANPIAYLTADGTRHVVHLGYSPTIPAYNSAIIQWYFRRDGSDSGAIDLMIGDDDAQPAQGYPSAYYYAAQGTQHVVTHIGGQFGHLQEFWYDGDWHAHDLTAATGAPLASTLPHGYDFEPFGAHNQHVIYGDNSSHIHELTYTDSSWNSYDLTNSAGAPPTVGDPFGYPFDNQQTQHVIYRGQGRNGGDLHELWWSSASGWTHEPLSEQTGAPPAASEPFGYVFVSQGTQHVLYRGSDQHVYELWWDTSGWHLEDLTGHTGAPLAAGAVHAYPFDPAQNVPDPTQHVIYIGGDDHLHELWWNSTGWHHHDLSTVGGTTAPFSYPSAAPTGFADTVDGTQHIYYVDVDHHVIALNWTP
jgi:hypothetical protein